jgi:hypothetical protein
LNLAGKIPNCSPPDSSQSDEDNEKYPAIIQWLSLFSDPIQSNPESSGMTRKHSSVPLQHTANVLTGTASDQPSSSVDPPLRSTNHAARLAAFKVRRSAHSPNNTQSLPARLAADNDRLPRSLLKRNYPQLVNLHNLVFHRKPLDIRETTRLAEFRTWWKGLRLIVDTALTLLKHDQPKEPYRKQRRLLCQLESLCPQDTH